MRFAKSLSAVFLFLAIPLAAPGEETVKLNGWLHAGPLENPPARTTDAWPLSDQANQTQWQPYAPLTDEFDAPTLDTDKWWPTDPQWLGRPPALFSAENVSIRDGRLCLTMRKETIAEEYAKQGYRDYTSASVKSKTAVLYGYFEIRARPMASAGSSSFWFYASTPEIWTEIDIFEIGGKSPGFERKYNMNVHVFHTPQEKRHWSSHALWTAPEPFIDAEHVYGLEWTKERIGWYFDGVLIRWVENTHWHQPLHLVFDSETMPEWFGLPKDEDLPSTFTIEYVRAWKKAGE